LALPAREGNAAAGDFMRRWLLIVLLFASPPAFAGGVQGPPSADDLRAERIAAGWKQQGPAAIPEMVKVVCRDGAPSPVMVNFRPQLQNNVTRRLRWP
jgi:hypothetical protein